MANHRLGYAVKSLTVMLPEGLSDSLDEYCKAKRLKKVEAVRMAVEEWLKDRVLK